MKHKIPEELISAYIDGELTSDEQALVEQALREDPQSQQLLEDLQSLHDRLQSIPRSEPSRDYTQQILRRAERAILTGKSGPSSTASPRVVQPVRSADGTPSPGNMKHLIWASTVLAASLLLAILFRSNLNSPTYEVTDATGKQASTTRSPQQDNTVASQPNAEQDGTNGFRDKLVGSAGGGQQERSGTRQETFSSDEESDVAASAPGSSAPLAARKRSSVPPRFTGPHLENQVDSVVTKGSDATRELIVYVSLSQEEFNQQTVVRTLLDQQVAFDYDPAVEGGFGGSARPRYEDGQSLAGQRAAENEEKLTTGSPVKRDRTTTQDKLREKVQAEQRASSSRYRVMTIETTPAKIDRLFQELLDHHQVELAVDQAVSPETGEKTTQQRFSSSLKHSTFRQLEALANRKKLGAAENSPQAASVKPAGRLADNLRRRPAEKTQDVKPNKPQRALGFAADSKAKEKTPSKDLSKKSNDDVADPSLAGSNRALTQPKANSLNKAATVRVVLVVLARPNSLKANVKPADKAGKKPPDPK